MKDWNPYKSKKIWVIYTRKTKVFELYPVLYLNTPVAELSQYLACGNYFRTKKLCVKAIKELSLTMLLSKHF
jgi:hypothetical protein